MPYEQRFRKAFLLLLVVAITGVFLFMIREFLLIIVMAGIFAGLFRPVFVRLQHAFGGRAGLASATTILLLFLLVVGPLLTVGGIVANQAYTLSQNVTPVVRDFAARPTLIDEGLQHLPFYDRLEPYRNTIITKTGELAGSIGTVLFNALSGTLGGTVVVIVQFVIFLYTTYFLLKDGRGMLETSLAYLPLDARDKQRMIDRFLSVARATLKGTLLIGALQGTLAGLAFWAVGVSGAIFWGTVMIILSIVPGIGGALVWVPAAIVLLATGQVWRGLLLIAFCALVVGSIDNVLRPQLVGRDTQMHELLIFFSTIGGLFMFGPLGFIVGPIVAALFVTVWEIYGTAFSTELETAKQDAPDRR